MTRKSTKQLNCRVSVLRVGQDDDHTIYAEFEIAKLFEKAGERVIASLAEVSSSPTKLIAAANRTGMPLFTRSSKEQFLARVESAVEMVKDLSNRADFRVSSRPGWHRRRTYVIPNGTVYPSKKGKLVPMLDHIERPHRWNTRGDLGDWRRFARWAGKGNPIVIFSLCAALLPLLLEILDMEGIGFLVVGPTSVGKTTESRFIASVWGGDQNHQLGFMESLNTTINALELAALAARDGFLVLEDTMNLPGGKRKQAEALAQIIATLITGVEKARLTATGPRGDWRLVFWMTSNHTLREIFAAGNEPYHPKYSVRLIEIPADDEDSLFGRVPVKFTSGEFVKRIARRSNEVFGVAIDEFLRRLADWRAESESKMKRWLESRMADMKDELGYDTAAGAIDRVGGAFCATYAAGCLGVKAGVLPFSESEIYDAVAYTYRRHRTHVRKSEERPDNVVRLRNFIQRNHKRFIDVRERATRLSEREMKEAPGFITKVQERTEYCFLPRRLEKVVGDQAKTRRTIDDLRRRHLLIHDTGNAGASHKNQTKRRLSSDGQRVRVYCVSGRILKQREVAPNPDAQIQVF